MFKSTLGVLLLLAFAGAYAQQKKQTSHTGGQSHSGGTSHATRSSGGASHATRSSSGPSHGSTGSGSHNTARSGSYSSHSSGSHHGTHTGTHRGMHGGSGGFGHARNVSLRPSSAGHPRDWFEHQHWMEGPAYQTAQFSCYAGFVFGSQPAGAVLVWVFDSTSNQYYQAYYYPAYGYYAWVSNPLVAVGEYSPQIAIVIQ